MAAGDRPRQPPRIDGVAKAAFLAALRDGARREDAAAQAGFSLMGFYGARGRDPAFKEAWTEALDQPPAAGRRALAYADRGEVRIVAANRRGTTLAFTPDAEIFGEDEIGGLVNCHRN